MDIDPFADNSGEDPDHDKGDEIWRARIEKPSAAAADHTDDPEGHHRQNDIPQSAMNPSIEHRIKRRVFHGIKIGLHDFPKEVEEERQEAEADFRYPQETRTLTCHDDGLLPLLP